MPYMSANNSSGAEAQHCSSPCVGARAPTPGASTLLEFREKEVREDAQGHGDGTPLEGEPVAADQGYGAHQ